MPKYLNRVKVGVSGTPCTGTITLGSADTGFLTFAQGAAVNGTQYSYVIEDTTKFEVGLGTYTSSGTTFSRDVVYESTAGYGIKETFTSAAKVFIGFSKQDVDALKIRSLSNAIIMGSILN